MQEFDPNRDDPRSKSVYIDSNTIFMRRTDPYGFIELSLERGGLPEALKNARFTTWEAAREAVDRYIEDRKKVALPEKHVQPVLERKKVP